MKRAGKWLYLALRPLVNLTFKTIQAKPRVRVLITDKDEQILLVKTWFGAQRWSLPGGGINRGERPVAAARRELHEETGIELFESDFIKLSEVKRPEIPFKAIVYRVKWSESGLPKLPKGRGLEIIDRKWYNSNDMPTDISPLAWQIISGELLDERR